jgi:alpha-D-xyloside xylohydrolase
VTTYKARARSVYLPESAGGWYDFWTGQYQSGGQNLSAPAPYDAIPLFVRAGSVIPFGPELQYTGEKPADTITLYVYAGANSAFTLYEDDGTTYGYEREESMHIPMQWDDAKGTLTLGQRQGKFPGMLAQRTFNIVLVAKDRATAFNLATAPGKTVEYKGGAIKVHL